MRSTKLSIVLLCLYLIAFPSCQTKPIATDSGQEVRMSGTPMPITARPSAPAPIYTERTSTSDESLAYKLASLNKGGYVSHDDITVTRFQYLLNEIEKKTENTQTQIADTTFNVQKLLKDKYGKEVTLLTLMEGANRAMPEGSPIKFKYQEIISTVAVLYAR